MIKLRYLTKDGDKVQQVTVEQAIAVISREIDAGNLVFDEDERRIVDKATMGKISENSNIRIFPIIGGG
ncbi:MAG: hypothetical protein QW270_03875 [Candidatus Bathyarchaeia archaeon]